MTYESEYQDYTIPELGETGWGPNVQTAIEEIDADSVVRGTFDNRPASPTDNIVYLATDQGRQYYYDGSVWHDITSVDYGSKLGPVRIYNTYDEFSSFSDTNENTFITHNNAGYFLSYYLASEGTVYVPDDVFVNLYYDGEGSPSFGVSAVGDAIADPPTKRSTRNAGKLNDGSGTNDEAWSYQNFETPLPYDSLQATVLNETGQTYPTFRVLSFYAETLDIPAFGPNWRRHSNANGGNDISIAAGSSQNLADVTGTRGRLYGLYIDADDMSDEDVQVTVTMDGESTPSFSLNVIEAHDIFGATGDSAGGGMFHHGEYDSGASQSTFAWVPGDMGFYSHFNDSMSVDVTSNESSVTITLDYAVVWDEEV